MLSQPVVIDGRTQPGFVGTPIIELNGNGLAANGLVLTGGNSIVRGLVINRFGGSGMLLQTNGGNVVEGNYIGTNTAGAAALPNSSHGIAVSSANNLIGGPTAAARNVISGNQGNGIRLESPAATANRLQGNYVGLNATGTAALANVDPTGGVLLFNGATANLIGGAEAGAGNVISGNAQRGIMISGGTASPDNVIQGNLVGTNPTGMVGLSNGTGIEVVNAPRTIIGGPGTARNVISGNQASFGISLRASTTDAVVVNNYIGLNAAGTGAIPNRTGLSISNNSDDTTVGGATAGLGNVISGNTDFGILVSTASIRTRIFGNLIGTNATGTLPVANGTGIFVSGVSGTIIGGSTVAARNVVSGNTASGILLSSETGTLIRGNYIGVRADGGAAIPNGGDGVRLTAGATGNSIGSAQSGGGNLISGNTGNGISLSATTVNGNEILGNRIGTDDLSTTSIPNGLHGISISDASANIIGGVAPAARNVISGNLQNGVSISGAAATGNLIASNFIGTNGSGMSAIANAFNGVAIDNASGNTIGTPDAGNVISGNAQNGIAILGASSSANKIYSNRIGVNALSAHRSAISRTASASRVRRPR